MNQHSNINNPNQAINLARYTENCEQARHHETLRERTTSMVFQTTGVMLGLLGFKEGSWQGNPIGQLIAVFIVLLGTWGLVSAILSESRIRRHRDRLWKIRAKLESGFKPGTPTGWTQWVWYLFHLGIIVAGVVLLAVIPGARWWAWTGLGIIIAGVVLLAVVIAYKEPDQEHEETNPMSPESRT